jgi:hypothetical protein
MAKWALQCRKCDQFFTLTEISKTLADYFLPEKPKFPPEGLDCECPHCNSKFTYEQHELRYQER